MDIKFLETLSAKRLQSELDKCSSELTQDEMDLVRNLITKKKFARFMAWVTLALGVVLSVVIFIKMLRYSGAIL